MSYLASGSTTSSTASSLLILSASLFVGIVIKKIIMTKSNSSDSEQRVDKEGRKLGRKMSFTSAGLAFGSWPEDKKVNEPIINVCLLFDTDNLPEMNDLIDAVKTTLKYERFSGVPVGTMGKNDWRFRECDSIDPEKLIRTIDVQGDDEVLYDCIGKHMQDSLREGRGDLPWWEFLLFKNQGPGKSSCTFRMEHCVGDGISLITLFENFIKFSDNSLMSSLLPASMNKKFERKSGLISLMFKSIKSTFKVLSLPGSNYDDGIAFRKHIGKDMIYSGKRKPVVFNNVPFEFIKTLKDAAGVSVNDVLFACLSQAISDYCILEKCPVLKKKGKKTQFRALMPIAMPRSKEDEMDKAKAMCNKWVFVSADMGVGYDNICDRLSHVNKKMMKIKTSPIVFCQWKVQNNIPPKIPISIAQKTVFDTFSRHSLVFSNVPGPPKPVTFVGKECVGCQMFFNNLIPQVGILSYSGQIFMNMMLDPEAIPNSDTLPFLYSRALVLLAESLNIKDVPTCVSDHASKCGVDFSGSKDE